MTTQERTTLVETTLVETTLRSVHRTIPLYWEPSPYQSHIKIAYDDITPLEAHLPIPTNNATMAIAFHEIGHLATRHIPNYRDDEMLREISAWRWAKAHLPYWNKDAWLMAVEGLRSREQNRPWAVRPGDYMKYVKELAGDKWPEWRHSSVHEVEYALAA